MRTVTVRLAGPMQAWSRAPRTHGGGGRRPTQGHPTKTGVIGLISNALGYRRDSDITHLTGLLFAVRTDRAGTVERDYRTAGGGTYPVRPGDVLDSTNLAKSATRAEGAPRGAYFSPRNVAPDRAGRMDASATRSSVVPSEAMYLADAAFTVALTGPDDVIDTVAAGLARPARLLHLGRVGYPLTGDLAVTTTDHDDPVAALAVAPPTGDGDDPGPWPVHSETLPGPIITDQPVDYADRTVVGRRDGVTHLTGPDFFTGGTT